MLRLAVVMERGLSDERISKMNLDQYLPSSCSSWSVLGSVSSLWHWDTSLVPIGLTRKNSPYECGFEAFEDARMKFDVRYYLVAILFILFDLGLLSCSLWALTLHEVGMTGFIAVVIFLTVLVVGFAYEWKKAPWTGNERLEQGLTQ